VASGEVNFIRSDIDLSIVLNGSIAKLAGSEELLNLSTTYGRLRYLFPRLGECQLHDTTNLQRWHVTDTYRGYLDRSTAIPLYGQLPDFPDLPVRKNDAVMRAIFWLSTYMPMAVRQRNKRNINKILIEVWNAYATSIEKVTVPYLTRKDAYSDMLESSGFDDNGTTKTEIEQDLRNYFAIYKDLHKKLELPEVGALTNPLVMKVSFPPTFSEKTMVLLTDNLNKFPVEIFFPNSIICTPEILNLLVQYSNPFLYWVLPENVIGLGILKPRRRVFLQACRYQGAMFRFLQPGFPSANTKGILQRFETVSHAVSALNRDEIPQPFSIDSSLNASVNLSTYYLEKLPSFYPKMEEIWHYLDEAVVDPS